ncbi:hypothetical protein M2432_005588 [Mycobacterium sp. OTB74]|nr:hypothetical protein [Mycobacterium sp. OTB74]
MKKPLRGIRAAGLHRELFSVLIDKEWKHGVVAAVDVTLLGSVIAQNVPKNFVRDGPNK